MPMVRPLLVLALPLLVTGCGWFDSAPTPMAREKMRPGVDRQTVPSGLPPAPQRGGYDGAAAPVNETHGKQVGSVVAPKGGQKAQLAQIEKERHQREAERYREREQASRQAAQPPAAPSTETKSER